MSPKSVLNGATLLTLIALAGILWYRNPRETLYAGLPYLAAALLVNQGCAVNFVAAHKVSRGRNSLTVPALQTRAQVFFLSAWQLAILGGLNIWANTPIGTPAFVLSNLALLMCLVISDRLVTLADSADQEGGYKPFPLFGLRRSRRFLFWICIVYPSTIPIGLGAVLFFKGKPYPTPFHPPQVCLLVAAVLAAGTVGLVFQRYRGITASRGLTSVCWLVALFIIGFAGAFELLLSSGVYIYTLSSISVVCTALSVWSLLRGGTGHAERVATANVALTSGSSGDQAATQNR